MISIEEIINSLMNDIESCEKSIGNEKDTDFASGKKIGNLLCLKRILADFEALRIEEFLSE